MAGSGQQGNVFEQSATGMQSAGQGLQNSMGYTPMTVTPQNQDIQKYLNPYTDTVINNTMNTMSDVNKIAQQGINDRADALGAFGGTAMATQKAVQDSKFGEMATNMASKLNEANYNQALQNSQFDITSGLQADISNQNAGLNANNANMTASTALGQLSNLGFNQGLTLQNQQAQEGALIQGLNQAILDAENAQSEGWLNQPNNAFATLLAGISPLTATAPSTTTETKKHGLLDVISMLAQAYGYTKFGGR